MAVRGDELQRGSVVGGYRIDELIGRGGMGLVYRATNVALNRIYALKVLAPALAEDEQFRQRFKRETRIAASLHHPNIVGIHYAGEHDGLLFFVMDYVTGTDLREILLRHGAIEPNRAVDLLVQLSSALDAAHGRGLVHRDVKPANVLITVKEGEEHAYLTDFGLAKKFDTASGLTVKGSVVGTVDYMAPEQITGSRTDARTDIYALGCVFFQMLSGNVPYERDNSVATLFAHVHDQPPLLAGGVADTYPAFAPVLQKAMAKEPDDRYLSAGDFARDAEAALRGMRDTAPPTVVGTGDATPLPAAEATAMSATPAPDPPAADPPAPDPPAPEQPVTPPPAAPVAEPAGGSEVIMPAGIAAASTPPPASPEPPQAEPVAQETTISEALPPAQPTAPPAQPTAPPPQASAPPPPQATAPPPPQATAPPPAGPPPAAPSSGDGGGGSRRRLLFPGLVAAALVAGVIVAVIALGSSNNNKKASTTTATPAGQRFAADIKPVPTNQVTGTGAGTVFLNGNVATVNVNASGLLNGAPHAMHIHAGGKGICPPAKAAHDHNGHLSISTSDGIAYYGHPQVALTSTGDTSPKSIIDFSRYPTTGDIAYKREITIPPGVAAAIKAGNAAMIVHGIDYNHNGVYDDVLDRSELNNSLPGEATAPALCGSLVPSKTTTADGHVTTIYAFVLHPFTATANVGDEVGYLCHLIGVDAIADPRTRAQTA